MRRALAVLLLAALAWAPAVVAERRAVAVIVHPDNPLDDLPLVELRRIFTFERQHWQPQWSAGGRVLLVMQEAGSFERELVLRQVYRMANDLELRDFLRRKLAGLEITRRPRTFPSGAAVKLVVPRYQGAIGFVDAALADGSVKVLRIDGLEPWQAGYPLAAEAPPERVGRTDAAGVASARLGSP